MPEKSAGLTATFELFEGFGDSGVQGFASEGVAGGYDLAGGSVDQVGGWNGIYPVELGDLGVPELSVVDLRPRHFVLFQELSDFGALVFLVQADSEDVEALLLVLLIGLDQSRDLYAAWTAPGGPEVEKDQLALVVLREVDRLAVHGRSGESQ